MLYINTWNGYIWDVWEHRVWFFFILWLFCTSLTISESENSNSSLHILSGITWNASLFIYRWLYHNHFIILWKMLIAHHIELCPFNRFKPFSLGVNIMIPVDFNEHGTGPSVQLFPICFKKNVSCQYFQVYCSFLQPQARKNNRTQWQQIIGSSMINSK